jgi:MFS family permease
MKRKACAAPGRRSAQGLITLATYGVGMLIGFWVAGHVSSYYATPAGHQWQSIWLFPAFFSLGTDSPL